MRLVGSCDEENKVEDHTGVGCLGIVHRCQFFFSITSFLHTPIGRSVQQLETVVLLYKNVC